MDKAKALAMSFRVTPERHRSKIKHRVLASALVFVVACEVREDSYVTTGQMVAPSGFTWENANPRNAIPVAPLGSDIELRSLPSRPTAESVRLGRWLFFDVRLSGDGIVACATCHRPEYAFSEPTPVSTGIGSQRGRRKSPALINLAGALYQHFSRDGRATSLEAQVLLPIASDMEMGSTHESMVTTLRNIPGYLPYFREAFGSADITKERVAQAIADYVRTRMSGNSAWDRWRRNGDESAVTETVKQGHHLFFGKAGCNQCHFGSSFTDSSFHNLGIGWNEQTENFADEGRYVVTKQKTDRGTFKTPTLREVTKHAPYMHDGSIGTLLEVVLLYNQGGKTNPFLDPRIRPLNLTEVEINALVAFLQTLEGEGHQDVAPTAFPQ